MLQVLGDGLNILRERIVSDSTITGTKDIALSPPVKSLDRLIYIPQVVSGGGYLGSSPYLGNNIRWEVTAQDNLQVINSGDPNGNYAFKLKLLEVNRNLAAQVVSANLTYSPGVTVNNIPINPVRSISRALVIPLYEYQRSYDRPGWADFALTSADSLQVNAYQYGLTSVAAAKFLIVNLP